MPSDTKQDNIILIGMAGTGKTTLGAKLSGHLSWSHLDTDYLLQAWWGIPLQSLHDWLGLEKFLLAEEQMLTRLNVNRCVISTGGSVVYGQKGMQHLKKMGRIIELYAELEIVQTRVKNPNSRGLAIKKGQTLTDLYYERKPLYAAYADQRVNTGNLKPEDCIKEITAWLKK